MDRNPALYMCEEQKKEIESLKEQLHSVITEKDSRIAALEQELKRLRSERRTPEN